MLDLPGLRESVIFARALPKSRSLLDVIAHCFETTARPREPSCSDTAKWKLQPCDAGQRSTTSRKMRRVVL